MASRASRELGREDVWHFRMEGFSSSFPLEQERGEILLRAAHEFTEQKTTPGATRQIKSHIACNTKNLIYII